MVAIATRGSLSRMPLRIFFVSLSSRMWLVARIAKAFWGPLPLPTSLSRSLSTFSSSRPESSAAISLRSTAWVVGFFAMSMSFLAAAPPRSLTMTWAARARSVPRKSGREMSASANSRARLLPRRASSWNAVRAIGAVRLLPR